MISSDFIFKVAQFCIEKVRQDPRSEILPTEKLFAEFMDSTRESSLTEDEKRAWLTYILRDLQMRHVGFRSAWDFLTNDVFEKVNFQLDTAKVQLYTLVPVTGLEISMGYTDRLRITEEAIVRKIARWEWDRYFRFLQGVSDTLPSVGLEYRRTVTLDELLVQYHDDEHFHMVMKDIRVAATNLQQLETQGMQFPWMIQYVPECQFTAQAGKIDTITFNTTPSNRPMKVYSEADVVAAYQLQVKNDILKPDLKNRLEVASRRFHEAANKSNQMDRIVDLWIVAESLFGDGEGNDARQVGVRLVCFLFEKLSQQDRRDAFIWIMKFWYAIRCKIVHGSAHDDFFKDFALAEQSQEVIRRTMLKLNDVSLFATDLFKQISKVSSKTDLPNSVEIKELVLTEEVIGSIYDILQRYDEKLVVTHVSQY